MHAFSWETLTEDRGILALIQSWKQTPGDSVGGLLLLWPWSSWGPGGLPGPWLGWGWLCVSSLSRLFSQ